MTSTASERDREDRSWLPVVTFIGGVLTGAALAALLVPTSGRETRERIAAEARRSRNRLAQSVYARKLEFQLEEWSAQIERLAADAGGRSIEARREIESRLGDLRRRLQGARETLDRLRTARGAAWREMAAGAERAWQELRAAVEGTASPGTERSGSEAPPA